MMKLEKLNLYSAIFDVYTNFEENNLKPRSADWLIYSMKREQLCLSVRDKFPIQHNYSDEEILKAWDDFGKNKQKYKMTIGLMCKKHRSQK